MAIKEFIEKAIEGGFGEDRESLNYSRIEVFLDPSSWQAVAKAEAWWKEKKHNVVIGYNARPPFSDEEKMEMNNEISKMKYTDFFKELWEGKTIEEALKEI